MIQTDLYSFSFKKGTPVPQCKKCNEENFYQDGKNNQGHQLYKCRSCGHRFVWTSDLSNRSFFSSIILFAVELYTEVGISLRTLAGKLWELFKVQVTHEGIRKWVLNPPRKPSKQEKVNSKVWHVDETQIKIKGKSWWLWVVYDRTQVLSWCISKTRTISAARKVLKKARQRTLSRPEKIITDGLKQYIKAIKKEIGWNWREQKQRHVVASGIGKNSPIERLNKEIKRRTKWFSTFQSLKGAKAFFNTWFRQYNQKKKSTQKS